MAQIKPRNKSIWPVVKDHLPDSDVGLFLTYVRPDSVRLNNNGSIDCALKEPRLGGWDSLPDFIRSSLEKTLIDIETVYGYIKKGVAPGIVPQPTIGKTKISVTKIRI